VINDWTAAIYVDWLVNEPGGDSFGIQRRALGANAFGELRGSQPVVTGRNRGESEPAVDASRRSHFQVIG
jgi:hypothetical protein